MGMDLVLDRDAMNVMHELRQVSEIAPKRIQFLAGSIDRDRAPNQDIPMLGRQFTILGHGIRIFGGRKRRVTV
jgi:hypothetical protein